MTTILRNRSELANASTADLITTYNALTGNSVERFSTRDVAIRRVDMALMAAEDAAAHRGIPQGSTPVAMTFAEIQAKDALDGVQEPIKLQQDGVAPDNSVNPFKPGTMAHGLWVATKSAEANDPARVKKAPKAKTEPSKPRRTELVVKATFAGVSKVQAASTRAKVLAYIQHSPDATANLVVIDAAIGESTRGYIQKLIEMKHLEVV